MGFADPFCPYTSKLIVEAGREAGATVHEGGTYVCIEGPQFSTRAESNVYRQLGFDIIGMTNLQEAKLAREAEPVTPPWRWSPSTTCGTKAKRT